MLNLTLFSLFLFNPALYQAFGFYPHAPTSLLGKASKMLGSASTNKQILPILIGLQLSQAMVLPLDTIVAFVVHALSRRLEFRADKFANVRGYGPELAKGLVKLTAENKGLTHSDW